MKKYFDRVQFMLFAAMVACATMLISLIAYAADFQIPDGDVASILLELATNYKALGVLGIVSALTLVSVQAIKAFVPEDWRFKRLTVLGVSIVYSVLAGLVVPGSNVATVILTVFISSGGAMALYEALKGAKVIK